MRSKLLILSLLASACCGPDPAVLFNAPPQLDGATVYVDGIEHGTLKTAVSYRCGVFANSKEMAAPPRHEANLAVPKLPLGTHHLRLVKPGHEEYRATFKNMSSHVEVFIPDEAVVGNGGG